jgi:hypothetical protein
MTGARTAVRWSSGTELQGLVIGQSGVKGRRIVLSLTPVMGEIGAFYGPECLSSLTTL